MNSPVQQLKDCLKLTHWLLDQAKAGEWELLERNLQKRDRALQALLSIDIDRRDAPRCRQLVEQINGVDQKLVQLATKNREHLLKQLKQSNQGQKMKAAYGKAKRPY